ncbi:MAG: NTP transferase domain-containing protein [Elusimicrobiota bacterium]|nr:NTP transferase domain-containing protein [Elusimicrobiota bacterium]
MRAGIIAAGEGSRLAAAVPGLPKPLIPVAGRPLAHWVVDGLAAAGAGSVTVLTNSRGGEVAPSLARAFPALAFDPLTADTASSFESFRLVCLRLAETEEAFLVSTTDALIAPSETARFWRECRDSSAEAGLALTAFVADEKPLWADLGKDGRVTALGAAAREKSAVTCGLYFMTRAAAKRLPAADSHRRLRDFLASQAAAGRVYGVLLAKTLDVDRPEDLAAAETFLTETTR